MPSVSIDGKTDKFQVNTGETLFKELQRNGHELPHSCLAGSCGACRVQILEGSENLEVPIGLEKMTLRPLIDNMCRIHGPDARKNTYRLSCQAKILDGDIKIKEV